MYCRILLQQGPWLPGYEDEAKRQGQQEPRKVPPRRRADWWVIYGMVIGLLIGGLVGATVYGAIGFTIGDIVGGFVGAMAGAVVRALAGRKTTRR